MNPDVFFENFELLADAPNGVQKLRELILQLAVMGKLVPQDPNDESVLESLEKIKVKKERLIEKGEVKKNKELSPIELEDFPFNIPDNWCRCLLGDCVELINGRAYKQSELLEKGTPVIRIQNLNGGDFWYYSDLELPSEKYCEEGDLLFAWSATFGPYIWHGSKAIYHYHIWKVQLSSVVNKNFIFYLLEQLTEKIKSQSHGLAMLHMTKANMENVAVTLPPLAEQKRIVSKVDELMALCDKLEARHQKKQEIQSKLNSAALDRMLSAENQEKFEQNWQRICENFDLLYDNPENVEKLRQTILQLAVQGKLVEQNPENEPASVLIEKIEAAKEKLVREGKSQKTKPLPEICLDELPYDLPDSWIWIRLGNISNSLRYGTSKKCAYNITGSPVLRIPNIVNGKIDTSDLKFAQLSTKEIEDLRLDLGDLLLVRSNGSTSLVGRSAVINSNLNGYAYAGYLVRLRTFPSCISPDYLHLVLESSYVRDQIEMPIRTTSGVKNINSFEISRLLLPIPPLEEQKRIVEKVEQFMGLCDELRAKLRKEREDTEKLMEAVVKGLLEGAATKKTELEIPIPLQTAVVKLK